MNVIRDPGVYLRDCSRFLAEIKNQTGESLEKIVDDLYKRQQVLTNVLLSQKCSAKNAEIKVMMGKVNDQIERCEKQMGRIFDRNDYLCRLTGMPNNCREGGINRDFVLLSNRESVREEYSSLQKKERLNLFEKAKLELLGELGEEGFQNINELNERAGERLRKVKEATMRHPCFKSLPVLGTFVGMIGTVFLLYAIDFYSKGRTSVDV